MSTCIEASGTTRYRYKYHQGKLYLAHRLAYTNAHGLTPDAIEGQLVRHTCDNPACVNPEHLILGTHQDNMDDKVLRDRCSKGSEHGMAILTESIVRYIKDHYKVRCREFGGRALAKRFKCHESTISDIMCGHIWRHIT